jgi:hypothetical protein
MRVPAMLVTAVVLGLCACGSNHEPAVKRAQTHAAARKPAPSRKAAAARLQAIIDDLDALSDRLPARRPRSREELVRMVRRISQAFRRGQDRVYAVRVPKAAEFAKSSFQSCLATAADQFDAIADDIHYRDRRGLRLDAKSIRWADEECAYAADELAQYGIKIRLPPSGPTA